MVLWYLVKPINLFHKMPDVSESNACQNYLLFETSGSVQKIILPVVSEKIIQFGIIYLKYF